MCFHEAINTDKVGIGFPAASTTLAIFDPINQFVIYPNRNKKKKKKPDQSSPTKFGRNRKKTTLKRIKMKTLPLVLSANGSNFIN